MVGQVNPLQWGAMANFVQQMTNPNQAVVKGSMSQVAPETYLPPDVRQFVGDYAQVLHDPHKMITNAQQAAAGALPSRAARQQVFGRNLPIEPVAAAARSAAGNIVSGAKTFASGVQRGKDRAAQTSIADKRLAAEEARYQREQAKVEQIRQRKIDALRAYGANNPAIGNVIGPMLDAGDPDAAEMIVREFAQQKYATPQKPWRDIIDVPSNDGYGSTIPHLLQIDPDGSAWITDPDGNKRPWDGTMPGQQAPEQAQPPLPGGGATQAPAAPTEIGVGGATAPSIGVGEVEPWIKPRFDALYQPSAPGVVRQPPPEPRGKMTAGGMKKYQEELDRWKAREVFSQATETAFQSLQTLKSMGATIEGGDTSLEAFMDWFGQTEAGTYFLKFSGDPKKMEIANQWLMVANAKSKMLTELRQIKGLGVRAIDTPAELEFYLRTFGTNMMDADAHMYAIDLAERLLGRGGSLEKSLGPGVAARVRASGAIKMAQAIMSNPGSNGAEVEQAKKILNAYGMNMEQAKPGGLPENEADRQEHIRDLLR